MTEEKMSEGSFLKGLGVTRSIFIAAQATRYNVVDYRLQVTEITEYGKDCCSL